MVAFLMGYHEDFKKFPSYLCLLNGKNTSIHNNNRNWSPPISPPTVFASRHDCDIRADDVKQTPWVEPKKELLPLFHIKLGLV